jgi:curved DNA-binding protein CbpA
MNHLLKFGWNSEMARTARRIVEARDLYDVLQLGHDVTPEDVKKAYHRTSKMVHPDKNKARQSDEAFKRVGEAFHTLSDPGQKQVYDRGLETVCKHRTEVTTRGVMDAHLRVRPQRPSPTPFSRSDDWSGVAAAVQAGHEAACPTSGSHWMAAGVAAGVATGVAVRPVAVRPVAVAVVAARVAQDPQLQAHNAQLQAHNAQLFAQNHQMHTHTVQLQAQNEQLQRQVTGLQLVMQPLVDRVRALENDAEAGGRRQRSREW